ncbi:MAG: lactonase family protein [Nakamurella sp.]
MAIPRNRHGVGALALAVVAGGMFAVSAGSAGSAGAVTVSSSAASTSTASTSTSDGAAFAMTNATNDNRIVSYSRAKTGTLTRKGSISTRGQGIGVDLDTQGPLRLSANHQFLYAVNAGSDNVSVFAVSGTKLKFVQKIYAGDEPTSLTVHGNLVYVLDGSVASNSIRGFTAGSGGKLTPIAGSIQPLSSPIAVPGDIEFSPNGKLILVTEKTTANTLNPRIALDAFKVSATGVAGPAKRDASAGVRPFAVAFRNDNQVLVAESYDASAGRAAVSSYKISGTSLRVQSKSVRNHQTDTCWIIVTHDGRYAYTANFGSGTISQYTIANNGTVSLTKGNAAFLGPDSQPVDLVQTGDSHYVYLLLRGTGAVAQFSVGSSGALTPIGIAHGGLPVADGASGLAVY